MDIRVAVVGSCASGKSSVVTGLRGLGVDAWAVAQEHSAIPGLWRHLGPTRLVFLDATLATVRARRGDANWPAWIYAVQHDRLANARVHADVVIPTDELLVAEIVAVIYRELSPGA